MNKTKLLATKEVTRVTGISGQTLKSYSNRGWISKSQFESHGRSGASLYWPRDVLIQIAQINALKKTGRTMDEINKILMEKK